MNLDLRSPGAFALGCTYWASHAGTQMWRDWQPEVVAADLAQLAQAGLHALRVFPLWPDFQPITQLYGGGGAPYEIRQAETPLASAGAAELTAMEAAAGLSAQALARFGVLADLAQQHGLKLIVGLLTGWMSGRLFIPPALEGRNVLTDPSALMWETRFVRAFVRRFKGHPAILAWDLGNECNCMAPAPSAEAAWAWTAAISNAIRVEDPERPVISGMHSLDEPDEHGVWRIAHQAELTDVLTTHPYPYFTPHCDQEPLPTLRNGLHATAQTRWYGDVGQTAALAEEVGTLGPMFASEGVAADYARMALFSLWAHDGRGMLWWCAYDQDRLEHAPYDWTPIERELGLLRSDRSAKPVLGVYGEFRRLLDRLPGLLGQPDLPPRLTEAVCILTHGQEPWATAFSSFILAKQAGFDLTFQYSDQPLREAGLYLLPSVSGGSPFTRRFWYALAERVQRGATLYVSLDDAILSPFKEPFGLEVQTRQKRSAALEIHLAGLPGAPELRLEASTRYNFAPAGADILGQEGDGNPAFASHAWGQGRIFLLSAPVERFLALTPGGFSGPQAQPFWHIYRHIAASACAARVVPKQHPLVGVTEHPLENGQRAAVLINYSPQAQRIPFQLAEGWRVQTVGYGPGLEADGAVRLEANQAALWVLRHGA